jgi:hypothetical protein
MGQQVQKTPAEVEKLRAEFESLPEAEPEMLGKRQVVVRLMPTIEGMQKKGYTFAMIANKFTENGIPLTVAALKSILSHAGEGGAPAKGKKRRKRRAQAAGQPGAATESPAPVADPTGSSEDSGKTAAPVVDGPKGTAEEPRREPKEGGPRKGPFTPRKDTGDG